VHWGVRDRGPNKASGNSFSTRLQDLLQNSLKKRKGGKKGEAVVMSVALIKTIKRKDKGHQFQRRRRPPIEDLKSLHKKEMSQ